MLALIFKYVVYLMICIEMELQLHSTKILVRVLRPHAGSFAWSTNNIFFLQFCPVLQSTTTNSNQRGFALQPEIRYYRVIAIAFML